MDSEEILSLYQSDQISFEHFLRMVNIDLLRSSSPEVSTSKLLNFRCPMSEERKNDVQCQEFDRELGRLGIKPQDILRVPHYFYLKAISAGMSGKSAEKVSSFLQIGIFTKFQDEELALKVNKDVQYSALVDKELKCFSGVSFSGYPARCSNDDLLKIENYFQYYALKFGIVSDLDAALGYDNICSFWDNTDESQKGILRALGEGSFADCLQSMSLTDLIIET